MFKFTIYYDDGEIHRHVCYGKDLFDALSKLRLITENDSHVWNSRAVLITREKIDDQTDVQ